MKNISIFKDKIQKYILLTVGGILAVSSIFMTIETATSGVEIAKLEKKEAYLVDQKKQMEEALVVSTSSMELQGKSIELGFVKPSNLVYVDSAAPVAKLP